MRSKYGVEYDLSESDHVSERMGMWFYFSSVAHKRKFDDGVHARIDWLKHSMSKRFHLPIDASDLAILQWYMMCETRGFRVGVDIDNCGEPTKFVTDPTQIGVCFMAAVIEGL